MKKLIFALILTILPYLAHAQVAKDQFFVIEDFSKGLQSHTSEFLSPTGSANEAQNVRINDVLGALSKRQAQTTYNTCSSSSVQSLHRYYKADSTKYTIATADSSIYNPSDSGLTCQQIGQGFTSGAKWNWVTYKNVAIGTNGYDRPVKWDGKTQVTANTDGSRTAGDLVAQLGAPFAEQNTGSDLEASKWYQYRVAYFDGTNYQYSAAKSNPILTGSTVRNITLTDIPLAPSGTTQRLIYRTTGQSSRAAVVAATSYYLDQIIYDNSTTTVNDAVADATLLADAVPKWSTVSSGINATPPYGKFGLIHKERLWLANDLSGITNGQSSIYFSELYLPDYFLSSQNYFLARPDDGDQITFLKTFLGTLYVGKTNSINRINTDGNTPTTTYYGITSTKWNITPGVSFIGSPSPYSVAVTPVGIFYLGRHGLYLFSGQQSSLISDPVTKDIRDINPANLGSAVGVFFNNEYYLAYASQLSGENVNNRVLVYDTIRNAYVKDTKYVDSWGVFDSGSDFGTLYSGSSKNDGKIVANIISPDTLSLRYKSEFDSGTFTNVGSAGDETSPTLEIAWGNKTIDDASFAGITIDAFTPTIAIIDRIYTSGTWISSAVQVNASTLSKLYWNSDNGATGTTTIAMRTASTVAGLAGAGWSAEFSNPNGSDVSSVTPNVYVQFRVTMNTSDITTSPLMFSQDGFVIKLAYSKTGNIAETAVVSIWKTGWMSLIDSASNNSKTLREMNVYYTGTAGTMNISFQNLKGDISANFNIDLSKSRDPSTGYFGYGEDKVFRYIFPIPPTASNFLVGDKFQMTVTETGTTGWKIKRLSIRYDVNEYVPMK